VASVRAPSWSRTAMELSIEDISGGCAVRLSSSLGVRLLFSVGETSYSGSLLLRCFTFT